MISHALNIVRRELQQHLTTHYGVGNDRVNLGNLAEGIGTPGNGSAVVARDRVIISMVNTKEENTLKNLPNYVRNDVTMRATYENPPVFLNLLILFTATHSNYTSALTDLSRVIRFFQSKRVFTQDEVAPASLIAGELDEEDLLETFKLIFDLYSPSLEEVNHLWGTLGGKQYPFILYVLRLMDLKFRRVERESGLIVEVQNNFTHKKTIDN